ncbi:site-specific integrase [Methylobacter psychrophilus]|uniref:site-specific integrase n=1 Tax=Methylobacter psychrophilus TaxID=96941 RepID=UPI0021D4FD10|nr:site-specific integrase [Methylobacter psychrophilus]
MSGANFMCKNTHGMYYARFIIPKSLLQHFDNKKEVRRSLQTDSRKLAIKRARVYRVEFEKIVDDLMSKSDNTSERAKKIIDELLADKTKLQAEAEEKFVDGMFNKSVSKEVDEDHTRIDFITFYDELGRLVTIDTGDDNKDLELYHLMKPKETKQDRTTRHKRAEEIHQAQLRAISAPAALTATPAKLINPKTLSEYFVDYVKYQTTEGVKDGWTATTTSKKIGILRPFLLVCDKPAALFDWDSAKEYIKIAHVIPKSFFSNGQIAKRFNKLGLTVSMLLDDNIDTSSYETRTPSSIGGDIKIARAFLNWIKTEERVKELGDAIEAFDHATRRISSESNRRAFNPDELKALFQDDNSGRENYVKGFNSFRGIDANFKYWLPLLGLYTGAALSELCQLHLSDIRKHKAFDDSEHWIIDFNVNPDDGDSRFKNDYRPRLIPIHKVLIDLRFTDYINDQLQKGEKELFPTARRNVGKYGPESFGPQSQWWGEYSSNAGVISKDVVFHSFKHSLSTKLLNMRCDRDIVAAFCGHSIATMASKVYRTGGHRDADIGPLVEWIDKIDYGLVHHPFKLVK